MRLSLSLAHTAGPRCHEGVHRYSSRPAASSTECRGLLSAHCSSVGLAAPGLPRAAAAADGGGGGAMTGAGAGAKLEAGAGYCPPPLSQSVAMCRQALAELEQVFLTMEAAQGSTSPSPALPPSASAAEGQDQGRGQDAFAVLVQEVVACRGGRIVVYGVGREGLMMRAVAMRLFHLGLSASVVGDMSAPAVGPGDLFIASAGPGSFSTVNSLLGVAKSSGARTVVLTAQPSGSAAELADAVVVLPAQTMADDIVTPSPQETVTPNSATADADAVRDGSERASGASGGVLPMGSVYEGAMFVFCEVVVRQLRDALGETAGSMRHRHTNLE